MKALFLKDQAAQTQTDADTPRLGKSVRRIAERRLQPAVGAMVDGGQFGSAPAKNRQGNPRGGPKPSMKPRSEWLNASTCSRNEK